MDLRGGTDAERGSRISITSSNGFNEVDQSEYRRCCWITRDKKHQPKNVIGTEKQCDHFTAMEFIFPDRNPINYGIVYDFDCSSIIPLEWILDKQLCNVVVASVPLPTETKISPRKE